MMFGLGYGASCGHTAPVPQPLTPPKGAVVRKFELAAIQADIQYNRYGDHDPEGLLFVPFADVEKNRCGCGGYKPLILRANAGDWIEITLHNMLDPKNPVRYNAYPSVPLDFPYTPSNRVSLNPQFLKYHPVYSSGINVGFNDV